MDPSQYLFAVLEMLEVDSASSFSGEVRVHLRRFSHPDEPRPKPCIPMLEESRGSHLGACLLRVADEALALFRAQKRSRS
jgi:hypothetical protein